MPKPPRTSSTATVAQPRLYVDWTTASLRMVLLVGGLVAALAGWGIYLYYQKHYGPDAPKSRAQQAVLEAQDMLLRAREFGRSSHFADALERSEAALGEAKEALRQAVWSHAEDRALDSQRASREVLDYVRSTRKEGPTAKFVRIIGTVEVKKRKDSRWVEAHPQMELDAGDLVRSKDDSSAQIIFFDGVSLMLSPASLIEVQLRGQTRDGLNRNPNVHLQVGTVDLSTPKFNVAATSPSLSTDNVEARLRNDTELRVNRDEASHETRMAVSGSGGANIQDAAGTATELLPNEGASVAGEGSEVMTVKRELPRTPLLVLPADLKVYHEIPLDGVELRWQHLSEASAYHVQISNSSLWARTLVDRRDITGEPSVTIKGLKTGEYYWRVAAIDEGENASPFSQYRKFSIKEPETEPGAGGVPPALVLSKKMVFENIVILTGKTEPGVTVTVNDERADVEEDGSFTHFTVLYNDGVNNLEVVARDATNNVARQTVRVNVTVF